jgi:ribonuclease D
MAAGRDLAPGRILPDSAVIAAVKANPESVGALLAVPVFNGPRQRRQAHFWFEAIAAGQAVPDAELPELTAGNRDPDVMPPSARWREREPAAAARLAVCRDAIAEIAERRQVVPQNLLSGETIRRLAWQPVVPLTIEAVREQLAKFGAREWQVDEVAHGLTSALLIAESLLTAD